MSNVLLAIGVLAAIPLVIYFAAKLGTAGYLRARQQFEERNGKDN